MRVLVLDGHPDEGRYCSHMFDEYCRALPADCDVTAVALRDLVFFPNLSHGYRQRTS